MNEETRGASGSMGGGVDGRTMQNLTAGVAQNRIVAQPKTIIINPLDHGYSVTVGCKTVAIESSHKLVACLSAYLADPEGTERRFFDGNLL